MDKIKTIQDTICKDVHKKCEKDFSDACFAAADLVSPFIALMYTKDNMSGTNRRQLLLKTVFDCDCASGVRAKNACGLLVPEEYVIEQTNIAIDAYMKNIESLQSQVEDLQSQLEELRGH